MMMMIKRVFIQNNKNLQKNIKNAYSLNTVLNRSLDTNGCGDKEILNIACIDYNEDEDEIIKKLYKACKDVGFFYVINHGIDEEKIKNLFEESKRFFSLPMAIKNTINASDNENFRGYTGFEEEILDPETQKTKGDQKEGFYIGREVKETDEDYHLPLHGPNQWLDEDILPNWRETMEDYVSEVTKLSLKLTTQIGKTLDYHAKITQPTKKYDPVNLTQYFDKPMTALRLLHYNDVMSDETEGIFGCGQHSDYGMITCLLTDDVPALQILLDDEWIDIPPIKNAFIVNIGDMAQRWTNNIYKSTVHRVINKTNKERYSIPFFFEPNFLTEVTSLKQCVSKEHPDLFPDVVTSGQYLIDKYNETHTSFENKE
eukprot:TRINITY_DN11815_c0_g1_i1.p1 TRINITY_DN11815_c0_g1~~TRINITY_DN11815_c0_g1_i1.p1  ORF type:complete len:371 (-),score=96.23 TRINITY_DN11815_c0_g1_i1:78-1190(-)